MLLYLTLIDDHEYDSKFETIYYKYHDMIYAIAIGITKDHYDAEEVMQNVFFIIAKDIENIKTENELMLKSYLYKITKNAATDIFRAKKRRIATMDSDEIDEIVSEKELTTVIELKEQYESIIKQIEKMPAIYRDVLVLRLLHEMPIRRIAVVLGRKNSTVKQQLNRGTKMLKDILTEAKIYE